MGYYKFFIVIQSEEQIKWVVDDNARIIATLHDKTNKMTVHPAKTQISLGIRPV